MHIEVRKLRNGKVKCVLVGPWDDAADIIATCDTEKEAEEKVINELKDLANEINNFLVEYSKNAVV